jgi:alpha-L-rhamnosidase
MTFKRPTCLLCSSLRNPTLALLILIALLFSCETRAADAPTAWKAQWIAAPDGPARDYDVVYFRRTLPLTSVPAKFLVDVTGDTRYELHVNGKRVSAGPALADVQHWRYEVVDLAPYLHAGDNQVAAIVWNFGARAALAQMSAQTAFVLSAEDSENAAINTGKDWQVSHERGRTTRDIDMNGYYAASPSEVMDGHKMDWVWDESAAGDPAKWVPAAPLGEAAPRGARDSHTRWILQKDELPPMQYAPIEAGQIVRTTGLTAANSLDHPLTIPAHTDVTLLLDRKQLTTAFPSLTLKGGDHASVSVTYSEALYDDKGDKGNRNEIAGRHIEGLQDLILADGGEHTYRTLWWRTWRYLQIEVKTADAPVTIEKLQAFYTAYPFEKKASFDSSNAELERIWDTGWRTAQLCSHETYMDTPYWEQLQYVGDTRIQAMISYAVTGDDRLGRQAMMAYRDSQLTDGLTGSRYPSNLTQIIPPFSLMWVGMLHDYWMYRDDPAFVRMLLPSTRGTLDWFTARQRADGLLGTIEWWPFVDWSPPLYDGGSPPQEVDGGSSALTLQFIEGLKDAAELEQAAGEPDRAARYQEQVRRASDALMRLNWDKTAGLLADTPAKKSYSQQANSLGVWLDVIPKEQQRSVMEKVLASPGRSSNVNTVTLSPASYYFRYYVARAMVHAGLGDRYIAELRPWRKMLSLGLSTWAETPEPTRSDSHAWSAHPTLDLLTIVAGIAPGSPQFKTVRITPHLGPLDHAEATMPTPHGPVSVQYKKAPTGWTATVTLPDGLPGNLDWGGKVIPLHAGEQQVKLP